MRGAMFEPTALLFWGMFALAGVWGGSVCLAADGAPGDAPAEEAAPPVLPMPESTPDGWTDAQFAALKRLEVRVKHNDAGHSIDEEIIDYYAQAVPWLPEQPGDAESLCIRRIRLMTDLGEIKFPRYYEPMHGGCVTHAYSSATVADTLRPEKIHIRSASLDVAPFKNAPESAILRGVDAMSMLRGVALPKVDIVTAKGPLPKAGPVADKVIYRKPYKETKVTAWPEKIMVRVMGVYPSPDEPGVVYYQINWLPVPYGSSSLGGIQGRNDLGPFKYMGFSINMVTFQRSPARVLRIVIREAWTWKDRKKINAMPLLVQDPFTPLPFVTDNGPLPPATAEIPLWLFVPEP